jgi:two-component system phosphate regulon response regulator PhoB
MRKILIVEDERAIRQLLSFTLKQAGFEAIEAPNAMTAIDEAARCYPELVLLDWQLPDMDGLRLLKLWRADEPTARMPVIMLSARITEGDRVAGLRAGADDYITKPFARDELLARIEAVLRRADAPKNGVPNVRECAGLELDIRSLRVSADKKPLKLGPIEFRLLNLFMSQPERAMSRAHIVSRTWANNVYVDERTVDVHVRRLRAALQPTGHDRLIQTVRGIGYRFTDERFRGSVHRRELEPQRPLRAGPGPDL